MNSNLQNQQHKQDQQVQSFHEPALNVLNRLFERNQHNLRKRGHDENNAAITRIELSEVIALEFRINQWMASQIVSSLVAANLVEFFGSYLKPKGGES